MRTFSVILVLVLALVRCTAPDTCVRNSDCNDGEMCLMGACASASGAPSSSDIVGDASSDASDEGSTGLAADASNDASKGVAIDAGTDAGSDAGNDADVADASSTD